MGIKILKYKLLDLIDFIFSYKVLKNPYSIKASAKRSGASYMKINDPNDDFFLKILDEKKIDLVVSFSAPIIFKKNLLSLPKYGCINLHCSILPKYAGLLPSFWTIYKQEKEIGSTVHYMDNKIDNGEILGQIKTTMPKNPTMFKVIKITKDLGGDLMCDVIGNVIDGCLVKKPNQISKNKYFTWPSIKEIRDFKKKGGRLI